jgi:hypothetical protein
MRWNRKVEEVIVAVLAGLICVGIALGLSGCGRADEGNACTVSCGKYCPADALGWDRGMIRTLADGERLALTGRVEGTRFGPGHFLEVDLGGGKTGWVWDYWCGR